MFPSQEVGNLKTLRFGDFYTGRDRRLSYAFFRFVGAALCHPATVAERQRAGRALWCRLRGGPLLFLQMPSLYMKGAAPVRIAAFSSNCPTWFMLRSGSGNLTRDGGPHLFRRSL